MLFRLTISLALSFIIGATAFAQETLRVQCGNIIEDEFPESNTDFEYEIELQAGDQLTVEVVRVGDLLDSTLNLIAPNGARIITPANTRMDSDAPAFTTGALSAGGLYTVRHSSGGLANDFGTYTIYFSCILRDGTAIDAGDALELPAETSNSASDAVEASTVGTIPAFGFPGLVPVDFSNGVIVPLQLEALNSGSISPGFEGIFGYSFSGSENETVTLEFTRQSGNLNLGLVVLHANNKVAFQTSLLNSNSLTTEFALPVDGDYTIGVFRIDLLPVAAPENTMFTISLNNQELGS
jgi:hypothetical protein